MIFKTIQDSVDKTKTKLLLFNKDWNTYKTNWQNANTVKGKIGSIFASSGSNTNGISREQLQTLRVWNNAVKHGCTNQETFNRIIAKSDENTRMYFSGLNKGKGSIDGLQKACGNLTFSAKANAAVLQTLSTAANMAFMAFAMWGISQFPKLLDKISASIVNSTNKTHELKKETEALSTEYQNNQARLDKINSSLQENEDRIHELNSLDKLSYVEEKELDNLKNANDLLKEQKTILEEKNKQIAQQRIDNLEQQWINSYETNEELRSDVAKRSGNILNWVNPNYYKDLSRVSDPSKEEKEKTAKQSIEYADRFKKAVLSGELNDSINGDFSVENIWHVLEDILKYADDGTKWNYYQMIWKLYDKTGYGSDSFDLTGFTEIMDQFIGSHKEDLEELRKDYWNQLDELEVSDPYLESNFAQYLISGLESINRVLDPESWEKSQFDTLVSDGSQYEDFLYLIRKKSQRVLSHRKRIC